MAGWGKQAEGKRRGVTVSPHTQGLPTEGANTAARLAAGQQPLDGMDNRSGKRNIIATSVGWVRRQTKTDIHGNDRIIDELLVPIPNLHRKLSHPDIAQIFIANTVTANSEATIWVVFNEPVQFGLNAANTALAGSLSLHLTNVFHGQSINAICNNSSRDIYVANNVLAFKFTPFGGPLQASAFYTIEGQAIVNATSEAANLVSLTPNTAGPFSITNPIIGGVGPTQAATFSTANLTITGAVSNGIYAIADRANGSSIVVSSNGSFEVVAP